METPDELEDVEYAPGSLTGPVPEIATHFAKEAAVLPGDESNQSQGQDQEQGQQGKDNGIFIEEFNSVCKTDSLELVLVFIHDEHDDQYQEHQDADDARKYFDTGIVTPEGMVSAEQ